MGFLAPALLGLAAFLAVPLVLHLFHRHQGPRVPFPALRYLHRAERERALQIRLRQFLLLALRLLVLALVVLAAARPFVRSGSTAHEPTDVVLVLDNSMSTGLVQDDARVLDRLSARALATLAAAAPDDRVWLVPAAGDEPAMAGAPVDLAERIRRIEPGAAAADLTAAVARAVALLDAAGGRAAEIQILTDLQAASFPGGIAAPEGIELVVWAPPDGNVVNRAVTRVVVGGGLPPRAGERVSVAAQVTGPAGDSVELRLVVAGRVRAATTAPAGATTVLFLPPREAGVVQGHLEIDPDGLRGDDRRYFTANVLAPPTVTVTASAPFVDEAVAVLVEGGRIRVAPPESADVLVAPEGIGLHAAPRTAIVLPPIDPTSLPAFNQRLTAAGIPWRYAVSAAAGEARLDADALGHELAPLASAGLRRVYALEPRGDVARDTVLLQLRDGAPWLVRGAFPGRGRYLLLASPLHPSATTIPVSAAMLPFLDHLAGPWAGLRAPGSSLQPGEEIRLPERARSVQRPDGRRLAVEGGAPFRAPPEAGVYTVWAADTLISAFAVNPPPRESDLRRTTYERVFVGPVRVARNEEEWDRIIFRHRRGGALTAWLLAAALGLFVVESLVAASGRIAARRQRSGTTATVPRGGP